MAVRGRRNPQASMLAFVDLEERVPPHHPLRTIKRFADRALAELSPTFDAMYRTGGRPSIPPERLLKASLLISKYSVRRAGVLRRVGLPTPLALVPRHESNGAQLRSIHLQPDRGRLLQQQVALQFFDTVVR